MPVCYCEEGAESLVSRFRSCTVKRLGVLRVRYYCVFSRVFDLSAYDKMLLDEREAEAEDA